ncbi:MAG: hypothetical protein KKC85_18475 [Gammaproteobacteria bacterium]|nr:hypothetical protein [Gammaproteobacteria bacterium]MBU1442528.1 hypothetical protein [Gammaproteobacteria bacterium]MBU2288397.1 hypothetical protein [Gammaproteobacteria bacterium]
MEPIRRHQDALAIAGLSTRTTNAEKIVMPHRVIGARVGVWHCFEANPQVKRRHHSDVEASSSPVAAAVYVGVG